MHPTVTIVRQILHASPKVVDISGGYIIFFDASTRCIIATLSILRPEKCNAHYLKVSIQSKSSCNAQSQSVHTMNQPISSYQSTTQKYLFLEILTEVITLQVACFIRPLHLIKHPHLVKSHSDLRVMALLPTSQGQNQQISLYYNSPLKYICQQQDVQKSQA